jgi:hypothetical protein
MAIQRQLRHCLPVSSDNFRLPTIHAEPQGTTLAHMPSIRRYPKASIKQNLRRERCSGEDVFTGGNSCGQRGPACVGQSDSKRLGRMPIERDDFLRPGVLEKQGRVVRGKAQPKPEVAGTKS